MAFTSATTGTTMELNAIESQIHDHSVPDLTPQTKDITMGQIKKENPPQMSCCYGIMVFLGLFASLLTLTLLVIYAGVWTQRSLYDEQLIVILGGTNSKKEILKDTELLSLPASSRIKACPSIDSLPMGVSGATGTLLLKHVSYCGGQISSTNESTLADCYKYTSDGWVKFSTMTKSRAFAASAWVPRRGWWVTGGMNADERDGISTTDLFNTGEDDSDEVYGPKPTNTFLLGPILPEAVSHHCLIKQANAAKYLLIGGTTPTNKFSSKVWEYDWVQRQWSEEDSIAPLYTGRHSHACALAHDGEVVVVAGGLTEKEPDGDGTVSVEILQISSSIWHKMPALPHPMYGGVSAKLSPGAPHGYGDFALVGGSYTNSELLQFVVRGMFETGNEATERSLTVKRRYAVVVVASPRLVCL